MTELHRVNLHLSKSRDDLSDGALFASWSYECRDVCGLPERYQIVYRAKSASGVQGNTSQSLALATGHMHRVFILRG